MSGYLTEVKCPVCGEHVHVPCQLHGGSCGDYYNPPEDPEVTWDINDAEFNCSCLDEMTENAPKFKKYYTSKRVKSEQLFTHSIIFMILEERTYHNPPLEECPLVEEYYRALESYASSSGYHYEPDEPPEYD